MDYSKQASPSVSSHDKSFGVRSTIARVAEVIPPSFDGHLAKRVNFVREVIHDQSI